MTDQQRNNDESHRPSNAESQCSTVRDFDMSESRPSEGGGSQASTIRDFPRDNDTTMTLADHTTTKEKNQEEATTTENTSYTPSIDSTQKAFQFTYTNVKIPEEVLVHPQEPLQKQQQQQQQQQFIKVPGQERITIVEDDVPFRPRSEYGFITSPNIQGGEEERKKGHPLIERMTQSRMYNWIKMQCQSNNNRYALQMAIAFTVASLFVIVDPISNIFPNAFWVGVSVVTVLENTVGGLLSLSLQRLMGTLIGAAASIVTMTVTRAIFHPSWEWEATVLISVLMFIQVFFISQIKASKNYAYVGNIGLLTTVILILSGYSDLVSQRMWYTAEMGAWRTLNLIIGIIIASIVSVFVFPLKASKLMRVNLGKAMENAADLYAKSSEYYLDFSGSTAGTVDQSLSATKSARKVPPMEEDSAEKRNEISLSEAITRAFSAHPPPIAADMQDLIRQQVEDSSKFWTHDAITNMSNKAFLVLSELQIESTRLRNVSNEYSVQIVFHIIGGGKERCKRDLRRAKRYHEAIEAMKRIVWPLVSFRLLLPLISISQTTSRLEEATAAANEQESTSKNTPDALKERIKPTRDTLDSFSDSLHVMRVLGKILKDYDTPISEFPDEWLEIDRMITAGNLHIQRELKQTVKISMYGENMDGLKLLSYYGFLVRCSMIWDGLRTVAEKLSPLNGTLSRASSMGISTPLPNREPILPSE